MKSELAFTWLEPHSNSHFGSHTNLPDSYETYCYFGSNYRTKVVLILGNKTCIIEITQSCGSLPYP